MLCEKFPFRLDCLVVTCVRNAKNWVSLTVSEIERAETALILKNWRT